MASRDDTEPAGARRLAFVLLFALMVVNYLDRQVVVSLFAPLRSLWSLSDSALALLVSIVSIMVAATAVPLSLLADRGGRVRAIAIMALVWSAATVASAAATSYVALLGARALVGLGEAAYGAVAVALLASLYPRERRSFVLGAFFVASIVGSVAGVLLGGFMVSGWDWRMAFVAAGVPGIVLAVMLIVFMRRYEDAWRARRAAPVRGLGRMLARAARSRTLALACAGSGLLLVPVSTIYAWLPSYLERTMALDPAHAGLVSGTLLATSGVGVLLTSMLADRLVLRFPTARLLVPALGALITVLLFTPAFALLPAGAVQLAMIGAGCITMMASVGPAAAVVQDVTPPEVAATGAAILAVVQNLLGFAVGPLMAGALSDRWGLQAALAIVPLLALPAAACFLLARRTLAADMQRAGAACPLAT